MKKDTNIRKRVLAAIGRARRPLSRQEIWMRLGVAINREHIPLLAMQHEGLLVKVGDYRQAKYRKAAR